MKSDLPKEVQMPINYFEKSINIINDNDLRHKIQFTGEIVSYFKNHKSLIEALIK